MKKLIALASAAVIAVSALPLSAAAEETKLPFELSAPKNVSMVWLEGNDSENTIEIHYAQSNEMSAWSSRKGAEHKKVMRELNEMGYDDVWVEAQIDWSIDTQDDWKVNEYWLTGGYDSEYHQHLGDWAYIDFNCSDEITMDGWIFRWMGNIEDPEDSFWYGVHNDDEDIPGWKDVLKEGQYDIIKGEDASHAKIDLTKHTIYTRVRWLVTVRPLEGDDIHIPSEWSEIAAIGKDAEKIEPLKKGDIAAPVISDLRYTKDEFNGYPVIAFKLAVDDKLAAQVAQVSGTRGGISLEVEARVHGTTEWVGLQGDWIVKAGEMTSALQNLGEKYKELKTGTPLELRARYCCDQPERDEFWTDYSEIIGFGWQELEVPELWGDINRDGSVDGIDALLVLKEYNSVDIMEEGSTLKPEEAKIADVDLNGKIEPMDGTWILKYCSMRYINGEEITWFDLIGKEGVPTELQGEVDD